MRHKFYGLNYRTEIKNQDDITINKVGLYSSNTKQRKIRLVR